MTDRPRALDLFCALVGLFAAVLGWGLLAVGFGVAS